MINIKKYVGFILCIVCSSSGLVACGNNATKVSEKVTISILAKNSWYTNVDYIDSEIVNQVIENSGYKVDWKLNAPNNYYDTVRPLLLEKSNLADIVQVPDLDANSDYINKGIFTKLDEYMDNMPNFKIYLAKNPTIKASLTSEDGHIYYVPQTVHTKNYQPCIMYNLEWLEKLGLAVPRTLDEFVEVLRAFKQNDMNNNSIMDEVPMSIVADLLPKMFGPAFGLELENGFYADENGVVYYSYYEKEKYNAYLQFLNKLYSEGLLESNFTSLTRDNITERCKNDQTGVIFDFSWQMSSLYSAKYANYDGSKPLFYGAPPLSGEYEGYYLGRTEISGLFGVTSISDKILDAVKLLDSMMSEKSQELYCWGIEGKSYIVNEKGEKEFTAMASDGTWLQKLGINPVCMPSRLSVAAADVLLPKWHSELDKELVKYVREPFPLIFAKSAEIDIDHGYTNYIAKYVSQQSIGFITGSLSMSSYNLYLNTLKSMKIEDVIKVKQAQYDRYMKVFN